MPITQPEHDKAERRRPHTIGMDSRKKVIVTGILDVGSFNEQQAELLTDFGGIIIKGRGIHIKKVNLETGDLSIEGTIDSIEYVNKRAGSDNKSLLAKIFR